MTPRTETAALSNLLCDLPDSPPAQRQLVGAALVRALRLANPDPDYADTVASGYVDLGEFDPDLYNLDGGLK